MPATLAGHCEPFFRQPNAVGFFPQCDCDGDWEGEGEGEADCGCEDVVVVGVGVGRWLHKVVVPSDVQSPCNGSSPPWTLSTLAFTEVTEERATVTPIAIATTTSRQIDCTTNRR
jgi:hypothetical protein